MKNIEELPDLMVELIEEVEKNIVDDGPIFTPRAVEIVKEISAFAKGTKIYKQQEQRAKEFWEKPHTAADVWAFMLQKIVGAPFPLYRAAAVLWHMPALEQAIEEAET